MSGAITVAATPGTNQDADPRRNLRWRGRQGLVLRTFDGRCVHSRIFTGGSRRREKCLSSIENSTTICRRKQTRALGVYSTSSRVAEISKRATEDRRCTYGYVNYFSSRASKPPEDSRTKRRELLLRTSTPPPSSRSCRGLTTRSLGQRDCSVQSNESSAAHPCADNPFEYLNDQGRTSELRTSLRHLERAADRGDASYALKSLRYMRRTFSSSWLEAENYGFALAFYNSTLRACKRSRPPTHVAARRLLLEMREYGPEPNARTYHEVIAALARGHEWRLAERTFAEMKRSLPAHKPSVCVYTSLISAYGKGGQWEKARNAFDALVDDGTAVDTGVFNAILSAAVSAAQYREATRVFNRMPNEGVHRNVTTYNAILTCLGRQRRLQDMEAMRHDMCRLHIDPNETTFSVLITAHGNAGDYRRACSLLDEACELTWLHKTAIIFNSALGACVKAGNNNSARRVLRLMHSMGVSATLVTFNTILMGASAERNWAEVAHTFRELLKSEQIPDAITYDCMFGIEKLQAVADARSNAEIATRRALLKCPEERDQAIPKVIGGVKLSSVADSKYGDLSDFLSNIVEEEFSYNVRIDAENEDSDVYQNRVDQDINFPGGNLCDRSQSPTITHAYDALLRCLHLSQRGAEVESTFTDMVSRGIPRTKHTYNSLIASYEVRRQWQCASKAMIQMQEEGITPDSLTFDALIDVCEETGQWDRATSWLEKAQEQGHLRCEDELGVLDLHRIRSAGTAQTVLRWWLRRMRSRALAPLDVRAAGQGTRAILESAKKSGSVSDANGGRNSVNLITRCTIPVQIRELPEQIQVVTGWGKHSTVFGCSPVKERVLALLDGLNSPFFVPDHNIGCVIADRGEVRAWLVRDELLSLVRFLGGNKDALKRNFNPLSSKNDSGGKIITPMDSGMRK